MTFRCLSREAIVVGIYSRLVATGSRCEGMLPSNRRVKRAGRGENKRISQSVLRNRDLNSGQLIRVCHWQMRQGPCKESAFLVPLRELYLARAGVSFRCRSPKAITLDRWVVPQSLWWQLSPVVKLSGGTSSWLAEAHSGSTAPTHLVLGSSAPQAAGRITGGPLLKLWSSKLGSPVP